MRVIAFQVGCVPTIRTWHLFAKFGDGYEGGMSEYIGSYATQEEARRTYIEIVMDREDHDGWGEIARVLHDGSLVIFEMAHAYTVQENKGTSEAIWYSQLDERDEYVYL